MINNEIENIQFCLNQYHHSRQVGYIMAGFAVICAGVVYEINNRVRNDSIFSALLVGSAALKVGSLAVFYDAEKWLKRASVKLAPGRVIIYF